MKKSAADNIVLILTHTQDHFTIDRVADAISRRGATPFRLDTDLFPLEVRLSARLEAQSRSYVIGYAETRVEAGAVRSVWARKLWTPRMADDLDPQFRAMCVAESVAALHGFFDAFYNIRWINDPVREYAAENKLLQLRTALEVGLRIPRTLNTNDPHEARGFFEELNGVMVAKLLKPLSISMGPAPTFVYTSDVRRDDLAEAEMLRHSPMVFQEKIPKARELRIAAVDGNLFVGAIDASLSDRGQVDWRLSRPDECRWQKDEVPVEIADRINQLMAALGLVYGAVDMIRTPDGEYVFLEVNPGGEWGMLERDLDLPISGAIADALLK